jgi:plasmid stabilization system protein ParE
MKRRTFVRPEAQADIREAATWYETREAGLGLRFVGEVRESLRRIADSPLRFPIVDKETVPFMISGRATRCGSAA